MGLRPLQAIGIILAVRIASVFIVQSWYVPDEYWQSLEVAHNKAFGYGYLTWEWKEGLRSFFIPGFFAGLFKVLSFLRLDEPLLLIYLPRILIALLTAASDYAFYKWSGNKRWGLFLILSSWFWFYCGSRTLANTVELSLAIIALSLFPFPDKIVDENSKYWILIASVSSYIRPTSAILWAPLGIYNLLTTREKFKLILTQYLPIGIFAGSALVGIDYICYSRLVITPWEFIKANYINDVGSHYGSHPWYWYMTNGLHIVLGGSAIVVYWAAGWNVLYGSQKNRLLLGLAALYIGAHSLVPHKEYRFLLPVLPLLFYVTQDYFARWSRKAARSSILLIASVVLITNAAAALYVGVLHQRGVMDAMPILREQAHADPHNTRILFAMPCHSTPLYSHLHVNVTTRVLDCTPPKEKIGEVDESERFYMEPNRWFRAEYESKAKPTLIVLFDTLAPRFEQTLSHYQLQHTIFHTHFPQDKVGENVLIYAREPATQTRSTQT